MYLPSVGRANKRTAVRYVAVHLTLRDHSFRIELDVWRAMKVKCEVTQVPIARGMQTALVSCDKVLNQTDQLTAKQLTYWIICIFNNKTLHFSLFVFTGNWTIILHYSLHREYLVFLWLINDSHEHLRGWYAFDII